jgi:hypothetical protein
MKKLKSLGKSTMSQNDFCWSVEKLKFEFTNRFSSYETYELNIGLEANVSHLSLFYEVNQNFIIPVLNNPFKNVDSSHQSLRSLSFETRRIAKEFENILSYEYPDKFIYKLDELFPKP